MRLYGELVPAVVVHVLLLFRGCQASMDLVAADCQPLCESEMTQERTCALENGCYEDDIKNNDQLFLQCWQPCWQRGADSCLRTCRDQHAAIKTSCRDMCAGSGDQFCPGFCFALTLDSILHGMPTMNQVGRQPSPPGSLAADTNTPTLTPQVADDTPTPTPTPSPAAADDTTVSSPQGPAVTTSRS